MKTFQAGIPRFKDTIRYEYRGERKELLLCAVYFFYLRARLVGINEILATFMQHLQRDYEHPFH